MNTKQALLKIQYDRNWEVWAKGTDPDSKARYVQPASERTEILEAQGWQRIADGVQIGDYVREYCDEVPDEYRADFTEEAVEIFLEEIE